MDWIDLAQDRDQWKAIMNLRVPYNAGNWQPLDKGSAPCSCSAVVTFARKPG
jgi:hypothetical protein